VSIRALSRVWEFSQANSSDLLVALALADFADDRGRAWPSTHTLMKKSKLSERQVQTSVNRLLVLKEINIYPNAGPRGVNVYQILCFGDAPTPAQSAPPQDMRGADDAKQTDKTTQPKSVEIEPLTPLPPQDVRGADKTEKLSSSAPNPSGTVISNPSGVGVAVGIPSEEEVLKEGKAYPGNLAVGAPPRMPENWIRGWYVSKLGYRNFAWERWQKIQRLDFEKDFRNRLPQALGDLWGKNGAGSGRTDWQLSQDLAAVELKIEQHPRSSWPGNMPLPNDVRESYERLLVKRAQLKEGVRNL
jgi:hypothetical protein